VSALRSIAAMLLGALLAVGCVPTASPQSSPATSQTRASGVPGQSAAAAVPLVIDTDMAPDDITAIASLLRDPAVDVRAITVVGTGEAHCPGGMFVARAMVTMLVDRQITVACGRGSPTGPAEAFPTEWRTAVDAGSGLDLVSPAYVPDSRPAPEVLAALAAAEAAAGGRLTILTLGTLTNVALALDIDAALPTKVRLVSMLGAVGVPGNVTTQAGDPTAEWNAHADPAAVRRVLEAGFDWTLVPLDATASVPLTQDLFARLESDHAAAPADLVFELWARNPYMLAGGFYLWDPLAAAVVRDSTIVSTEKVSLAVTEGDGLDGGRLRVDPAGRPASVALSADQGRFESLLLDRLRIGAPREHAFSPSGSVEVGGGVDRCQVKFDPATRPAGLLRISVMNWGGEPLNAVVFELAGASWSEVEAYVDPYDPAASPPPVTVLTQLGPAPGASSTAYVTVRAGDLGVGCFTGTPDAPKITLAGPFAIGR
jgi:inosine-uridine nucleoside N-ribohydrolase